MKSLPTHATVPVQEITEYIAAPTKKLFQDYPYLILCMDLRLTDSILLEETELLIKKKREALAMLTPGKRRGPKSKKINASYTDAHFGTWVNRKIVQLTELKAWAHGNHVSFNDDMLGRWLFPAYSRPKEELFKAMEAWRDAVKALPALKAQIDRMSQK